MHKLEANILSSWGESLVRKNYPKQDTRGRLIQKHVLEKAKKYMENPDLNLSEIAYKCGYQDLSSFTRSFKKSTGVNPGKYRVISIKQWKI